MPSQYDTVWRILSGYSGMTDGEVEAWEELKRERREEEATWTRRYFKTIFPEAFPRTAVSRVDKETVRDKVDVLHLLASLGITHRVVGGNALFCCILHDDKNPSASFSVKKKVWYCHPCARGGDPFTFIMELEGLNFPQSVEYLDKMF